MRIIRCRLCSRQIVDAMVVTECSHSFMDDVTLSEDLVTIEKDIITILESSGQSPDTGLHLNTNKCELIMEDFTRADGLATFRDFVRVDKDWVGKSDDFRPLSRNISETAHGRNVVTMEMEGYRKSYALDRMVTSTMTLSHHNSPPIDHPYFYIFGLWNGWSSEASVFKLCTLIDHMKY